MIKQMAWNTFKNTGNINTFLELMELENLEKNIYKNNAENGVKVNEYGEYKDQGNNITGK
jgi:hypothetical protein